MAHRASHKDSWGSRELAEGRDALGHHSHGAGMLLGCCSPCWDYLDPTPSETLLCLSCLGLQKWGSLRQAVFGSQGSRVKAVAGNNNKNLGYRSPSQVRRSKGCSYTL